MVLGNDHSEGYIFGSAEREATGGGDSSDFTSNGLTADRRDDELDTPNTHPTQRAQTTSSPKNTWLIIFMLTELLLI